MTRRRLPPRQDLEALKRAFLRVGYIGLGAVAVGTAVTYALFDVPWGWGMVAATVWSAVVVTAFLVVASRRTDGRWPDRLP